MGRELKRVALDFDWPLDGGPWKGYLNPHYQYCKPCPFCGQSGYNEETKKLSDDWYAFDKPRGEGWMYRLEESDIAALIEANRLVDFTHQWKDGKWVRKDPPFTPTPEEVNAWARRFIGHDAINQWVCVEARAKRLGIWGKCLHCEGEGDVWRTPEDKANAEKWTPTEPPEGDGYQIWETVSEGSPVSPVFATPEELADWMVANDDSITKNTTRDQWLKFIKGPGWAPSLIAQGGTVKAGTEAQP